MILIQHPVASFENWKRAFDSDPMGRARNGVVRHAIHRDADERNYVLVSLEFASLEQAKAFLARLRELWRNVGDRIGFAVDGVQARVLEDVERIEY